MQIVQTSTAMCCCCWYSNAQLCTCRLKDKAFMILFPAGVYDRSFLCTFFVLQLSNRQRVNDEVMSAITECINPRLQSPAASSNLPLSFALDSFFYANPAEYAVIAHTSVHVHQSDLIWRLHPKMYLVVGGSLLVALKLSFVINR